MNRTQTPGQEPDALLDAVGVAFARMRRRTALVAVDPPLTRKDMARNQIINIVDEADGEMTVGGVAYQLTVDPSVASRMVTDCISAGLLERAASQGDGRRTVLHLTPQGITLRDRFRSQHRQAFVQLTRDWPAAERREFARLILKYADATAELGPRTGPPTAQPTPRA